MTNLISRTIAQHLRRRIANVSSLVKELQVKRFLAVVVVGFLLLTTNVAVGQNNDALGERVVERVHQTDQADRPKTTGEWNQEARETEGAPGKRLQRIGKESAEAFKQFGSGYAEGAKETARDVQKNTTGAR